MFASSCSQTCMEKQVPWPITAVPDVMNICLPSGQSINGTLLERKLKSSCLLVESRRKFGQLLGILFSPVTLLRIPFPLFSLTDSLMILAI